MPLVLALGAPAPRAAAGPVERRGNSNSVLCNGGDGPPFYADYDYECYNNARDRTRDKSKDSEKKGRTNEDKARDAKRIGDRLAADREKLESLPPEERNRAAQEPYVWPSGLGPAASAMAAQEKEEGRSEPPVLRAKGDLLRNPDPARTWHDLSRRFAERAEKEYKDASDFLGASKGFQQLGQTGTKRRQSMVSFEQAKAVSPARSGQGAPGESSMLDPRAGRGESAPAPRMGAGGKAGGSDLALGGQPASPAKGEAAGDVAAGAGGKGGAKKDSDDDAPVTGVEKTLDHLLKAGDAKKDPLQLLARKGDAKGGGANALDLFERAMDSAGGGEAGPAGDASAAPAVAEETEVSLFTRVHRSYRQRAKRLETVY